MQYQCSCLWQWVAENQYDRQSCICGLRHWGARLLNYTKACPMSIFIFFLNKKSHWTVLIIFSCSLLPCGCNRIFCCSNRLLVRGLTLAKSKDCTMCHRPYSYQSFFFYIMDYIFCLNTWYSQWVQDHNEVSDLLDVICLIEYVFLSLYVRYYWASEAHSRDTACCFAAAIQSSFRNTPITEKGKNKCILIFNLTVSVVVRNGMGCIL